jgi:hypothetical protein
MGVPMAARSATSGPGGMAPATSKPLRNVDSKWQMEDSRSKVCHVQAPKQGGPRDGWPPGSA